MRINIVIKVCRHDMDRAEECGWKLLWNASWIGCIPGLTGSRYIMQLLITKFVGCLRWLFSIPSVQLAFNETVTDSVNLLAAVGIPCIGNLAVFAASLFSVGVFKVWQGSPFIIQVLIWRLAAAWDLYLLHYLGRFHPLTEPSPREPVMPWLVQVLEIVCIISGIAGTLGVKAFGRWIYGVK